VRRAELPDHPRSSVVTGGASGIGLGIVRHFLALGGSVVAVDRDAQACASARVAFGRLDLVCNNAAIHPIATIEEMDLAAWNEAFRVNVSGAFLCIKRALPHMKKQGAGTIVNIGSVSGVSPYVGGGAYAATKAALAMLTRVLALESRAFWSHCELYLPGFHPASNRRQWEYGAYTRGPCREYR